MGERPFPHPCTGRHRAPALISNLGRGTSREIALDNFWKVLMCWNLLYSVLKTRYYYNVTLSFLDLCWSSKYGKRNGGNGGTGDPYVSGLTVSRREVEGPGPV